MNLAMDQRLFGAYKILSITILELARQTSLSEPGIKKHLKKLQEQGLLKRVGPDKGGHWEVVER